MKAGGDKIVLATIHSLLNLIANLAEQVSLGRSIQGTKNIINDIISVVQILQEHVRNPGTRAVLANVDIELYLLLFNMRRSSFDKVQVVSACKRLTELLSAAFNGLKSGTNTGGFSDQRGALQNIFFFFDMMQSDRKSASSKLVKNWLQQLSFLFDGLELTTSSQSSKNILQSIVINLDIMLKISSSRRIPNDDLLRFIKMTANCLNLVFDLRGISGTGKFVGGSSSSQYLQHISVELNDLQISIKKNDMSRIKILIFRLGN